MILVEGKADQVLVLRLTGLPARDVPVIGDRAEVMARFAENTGAWAMVDEDPGQTPPVELERMLLVEDLPSTGLRTYSDGRTGARVTVLCPRLEEWILASALEVNIDLRERRYNLPSSPSQLHRVINRDLRKLQRLIAALLAAQSPRILKLQQLLTS